MVNHIVITHPEMIPPPPGIPTPQELTNCKMDLNLFQNLLVYVMVITDQQLYRLLNHLDDGPLGMYTREFLDGRDDPP